MRQKRGTDATQNEGQAGSKKDAIKGPVAASTVWSTVAVGSLMPQCFRWLLL